MYVQKKIGETYTKIVDELGSTFPFYFNQFINFFYNEKKRKVILKKECINASKIY